MRFLVHDGDDYERVSPGELRKLVDEGLVIACKDQVDEEDHCEDFHPTLRSSMDDVLTRLKEIRDVNA